MRDDDTWRKQCTYKPKQPLGRIILLFEEVEGYFYYLTSMQEAVGLKTARRQPRSPGFSFWKQELVRKRTAWALPEAFLLESCLPPPWPAMLHAWQPPQCAPACLRPLQGSFLRYSRPSLSVVWLSVVSVTRGQP